MNRRSFITALAGLPIVGWGAGMLPKAKCGITVHGPELIVIHSAYGKPWRTLSLRFEQVPADSADEVVKRLKPVFWSANSCRFSSYPARTLIFAYHSVSHPKNGHCSVICAFKPSHPGTTWNDSHRPVDFETEILKALTA